MAAEGSLTTRKSRRDTEVQFQAREGDMNRWKPLVMSSLFVAALLLTGCEGYTEMNSRSSQQQDGFGGRVTVSVGKANGTSTKALETESSADVLDATVVLTVGSGSYKIELLGENGEVTLALEALGGETVRGQGRMAVDTFGDASYRVTALDAEQVEYSIEYTFR